MRRVWLIGVLPACAALSPTQVVKSPINDRCEAADLKACPEFVDGVIAYIDGDTKGGEAKIRRAAGANSPEQVRAFSAKLREVSSVPGAGDFAKPLNEIAFMLTAEAKSGGVVEQGAMEEPSAPAGATSAASPVAAVPGGVDFDRLRTDSVILGAQPTQPCKLGSLDALCGNRRFRGPLVVTDAVTGRGCTDQLFVGSQQPEKQEIRWLVDVSHPGVHAAAFVVRTGELLFLAAVPSSAQPSTDPRCTLTWAAYRPKVATEEE